jgi:hypothetical protein
MSSRGALDGLSTPRQTLGSLLPDGVPSEGLDPGAVGERRRPYARAVRPTTRQGPADSTQGRPAPAAGSRSIRL